MNNHKNIFLALVIGQFALMMGSVGVLSTSINWPVSLSLPAAELMKLVAAFPNEVKLGYILYLSSTLLFIPIILFSERVLRAQDNSLMHIGSAMGFLGVIFKAIGILRWLTIQPLLAQNISSESILLFDSINKYFGAMGENLGVMLGIGSWTVAASLVLKENFPKHRWIASLGVGLGVVITAGIIELMGIDLPGVYLTITGAGWQIWILIMALRMNLTSRNK